MDFTFLDKCFGVIRPQTWKRVNELLGQYGVAQKAVSTDVIRTDTTAVESNIHYPTDSSLLWDTWRVASRLLKRARELAPESCPHRFHDRKIKRLHLYITRYMPSKSKSRQRKVKTSFATLIERTTWIVAIAGEFCTFATTQGTTALAGVALELKAYLSSMQTIVHNARRAQVAGETVPASERVFSLFEQHTELIKRGKRQKPVEFGHKVLLCESKEKFITDYEVYEKQLPDCELTEEVIQRHKKLFGRGRVLSRTRALSREGEVRGISEASRDPGDPPPDAGLRRQDACPLVCLSGRDRGNYLGLERAFRLVRCYFRGFRNFATAVGLGVFCHNLIVLADHASG